MRVISNNFEWQVEPEHFSFFSGRSLYMQVWPAVTNLCGEGRVSGGSAMPQPGGGDLVLLTF